MSSLQRGYELYVLKSTAQHFRSFSQISWHFGSVSAPHVTRECVPAASMQSPGLDSQITPWVGAPSLADCALARWTSAVHTATARDPPKAEAEKNLRGIGWLNTTVERTQVVPSFECCGQEFFF